MKRVYVTESGYFDERGHFCGTGIIGVDFDPRFAASYPIRHGCYRHEASKDSLGFDVIYKSCCSDKGYRLTVIDAY